MSDRQPGLISISKSALNPQSRRKGVVQFLAVQSSSAPFRPSMLGNLAHSCSGSPLCRYYRGRFILFFCLQRDLALCSCSFGRCCKLLYMSSSMSLLHPGSRQAQRWESVTKATVSTEILITLVPLAIQFTSLPSRRGLHISSFHPTRERNSPTSKSTTMCRMPRDPSTASDTSYKRSTLYRSSTFPCVGPRFETCYWPYLGAGGALLCVSPCLSHFFTSHPHTLHDRINPGRASATCTAQVDGYRRMGVDCFAGSC